jgi:peptidoglycan-associated lipoprotein
MNIMRLAFAALAAAALVMTGCSSTGTRSGEGGQGAQVVEGGSGATTQGIGGAGNWQGNPLDNPNSLLSERNIYFDFDKSDIRQEYIPMLRAHAGYLNDNRQANVTIEGHTDERGSREYNIALGERRANSVKRFLEAEGVDPAQISTVSYGEERPEALGHDEAAWAQNRRAVLDY